MCAFVTDRETTKQRRIAWIAPINPSRMQSGLEERIERLSNGLAERFEVSLFVPKASTTDAATNLKDRRVRTVYYGSSWDLDSGMHVPAMHPTRIILASRVLQSLGLYKSLSNYQADIVIVEFPYNFLVPKLYCLTRNKPIILSEQNVEYLLLRRTGSRFHWLVQLIERLSLVLSDRAICASGEDRVKLLRLAPGKQIDVVQNGVDTKKYHPISDEERLAIKKNLNLPGRIGIFHGSFDYPPNREAASWLDREIVPRIMEEIDDFQLVLAGRKGEDLKFKYAKYLNFVDNLEELLAISDIALVPLTAGSGTKLKLLQYLSSGIPTVVSPIGAEGLDLADGIEAEIAEVKADVFARRSTELLKNKGEARRMGARAREKAVHDLDWRMQISRLHVIVEETVNRGRGVQTLVIGPEARH